MDDEARQKRVDQIVEELGELAQEFLNITHIEDGTTRGVLTSCVVAFEGMRYDNNGDRIYRTDYVTVPPTSYSGSIGILQETIWNIHSKGWGSRFGDDI